MHWRTACNDLLSVCTSCTRVWVLRVGMPAIQPTKDGASVCAYRGAGVGLMRLSRGPILPDGMGGCVGCMGDGEAPFAAGPAALARTLCMEWGRVDGIMRTMHATKAH